METAIAQHKLTDEEIAEVARQYLSQHGKVTIGWLTYTDAMRMTARIKWLMEHHGAQNVDELIRTMRERGDLDNVRGVKRVDGTLKAVENRRHVPSEKIGTVDVRTVDVGEAVGSLVDEVAEKLS